MISGHLYNENEGIPLLSKIIQSQLLLTIKKEIEIIIKSRHFSFPEQMVCKKFNQTTGNLILYNYNNMEKIDYQIDAKEKNYDDGDSRSNNETTPQNDSLTSFLPTIQNIS